MKAIVYVSKTGHTKSYAEMLGKATGLPIYELKEAAGAAEKGSDIIYMGWLFASSIKGYKKAAKRYNITAVCGVGLGDTGSQTDTVRKSAGIPGNTPLFTLQGGINRAKLKGMNKFMINMLTKSLGKKANPTDDDKRMLYLLTHDASYVSDENLSEVLEWYKGLK